MFLFLAPIFTLNFETKTIFSKYEEFDRQIRVAAYLGIFYRVQSLEIEKLHLE